jgi:hypothetical protein
MKKTLLVAALAALSIGAASADTNYITGSTAFRKAANSQIAAWVESQAQGGTNNGLVWSDTASGSPVGATDIAWQWISGSQTNYIVAHWSGSEGGIQNTAAPIGTKTYGYLNVATAGLLSNPVSFATGLGKGTTNSTNTLQTNGNITFSDTTQSSSLFKSVYAGTTYNSLTAAGTSTVAPQVGVVTFAFVVNLGANTNIVNFTSENARNLLNLGKMPVALLTGSNSDTNSFVWLVGRDIDSGTRLTTLGETGYGTSKAVNQYFTVGTTNVYLTPQTTVNGVTEVLGNGGYSSGSASSGLVYQIITYGVLATGTNLTVGMGTNSTPNTTIGANYLLGYAGTGDAGKASGTVRLLAYQGTTYSDLAVQEGQYGFWGYENMYYNASTTVANTVSVANGIAANLLITPTGDSLSGLYNAGVQLSTMLVSRGSDFSVILQNY